MPVLIRANSINNIVKKIIIKIGAIVEIQFFRPGLNPRSNMELETTDIELKAIANPASSGFSTKPSPMKTRAAIGIPITL